MRCKFRVWIHNIDLYIFPIIMFRNGNNVLFLEIQRYREERWNLYIAWKLCWRFSFHFYMSYLFKYMCKIFITINLLFFLFFCSKKTTQLLVCRIRVSELIYIYLYTTVIVRSSRLKPDFNTEVPCFFYFSNWYDQWHQRSSRRRHSMRIWPNID